MRKYFLIIYVAYFACLTCCSLIDIYLLSFNFKLSTKTFLKDCLFHKVNRPCTILFNETDFDNYKEILSLLEI